ncbi:PREDICTED: uncharacterized protein LOC104607822 [Nelumbo nucifera]|uniref:Uncharacterized protein LOC104607822 n=1 Tax=Nelumbo nucifera TaxID=4432 RepID=A0A1U8Q8X4_NELNU|nr:PREDICTED: uncharacterized protein LOC104607822 [Nelumbo nucifera]
MGSEDEKGNDEDEISIKQWKQKPFTCSIFFLTRHTELNQTYSLSLSPSLTGGDQQPLPVTGEEWEVSHHSTITGHGEILESQLSGGGRGATLSMITSSTLVSMPLTLISLTSYKTHPPILISVEHYMGGYLIYMHGYVMIGAMMHTA